MLPTGFRLAIGVLAVAVGFFPDVALAQGAKRVINATTITTYPPFSFKDPVTNKVTGFDIDTLNAVAAKMGAEVNWIETSFAQQSSFSDIKTGRADMNGSSIGDTPERRAVVSFLDYVYDVQVFYTLRSNVDRFSIMDAVCGARVAIPRSSALMNATVTKWSEDNCTKAGKPAVIVVGSDNVIQSQLMLNQGRIDVSVTGAAALAYQNTLEGNRYATFGTPLVKVLTGMAFRQEDTEFGHALKNGLASVIADGTYAQLLRKWNMPDEASIQQSMINGQP